MRSRSMLVRFFAVLLVILPIGSGLFIGSSAQVPGASADFAALATGTVIHADALQDAIRRVADVEVGFSGAFANSRGAPAAALPTENEMQRVVVPTTMAGKFAVARGSGLELGLGNSPPNTENIIVQAGRAEASALPVAAAADIREIGTRTGQQPPPLDPLAYFSLLRGQARALWETPDPCGTLGADLSFGLGYAADVQLLDLDQTGSNVRGDELEQPLLATDHPSFPRAVSQSASRTLLVPQVRRDGTGAGQHFGVMSEVRETIAPITLFKNSSSQTTIEVLGEWVLQVVAGGVPGSAFVRYGPAAASPDIPVLRILNALGQEQRVLSLGDITRSPQGLIIQIPPAPAAPLVEIAIGEDPRAIRGNAASAPTEDLAGLTASAAVDVVRVRILEQPAPIPVRAADIRVGHMEASARVPAGGISCSLPVSKSASPSSVAVGRTFTTTITVRNPFECPLEAVRVSDDITTQNGALFTIQSSSPVATTATQGAGVGAGTVIWNDIGTIPPNSIREVSITMLADAPGRIVDTATATGALTCPPGAGLGEMRVAGTAITRTIVTGTSAPLIVTPVGGPQPPDTPPPPVVTKAVSPSSVFVGDTFTATIAIRNPANCNLQNVRLTDTISTDPTRSARFRVESTSPLADIVPTGESLTNAVVTWNEIGPIPAGSTKSVSLTIRALQGPGELFPARIDDVAAVTGTYACAGLATGTATASASSQPISVPVSAVLGEVIARPGVATPAPVVAGIQRPLPRNGANTSRMALVALTMIEIGAGLILLSERRRRYSGAWQAHPVW